MMRSSDDVGLDFICMVCWASFTRFLSMRYDAPLQTEQSWFHAKVGRIRPPKECLHALLKL